MTYDKSRGFHLEGPDLYLIYLGLYLSREIIEVLLLSLIVKRGCFFLNSASLICLGTISGSMLESPLDLEITRVD